MVEACFKNGPHFLGGFAIQKWMEIFVNQFLDYAGTLCKGNEVVFFLVSES